jgi:hypothetical protein
MGRNVLSLVLLYLTWTGMCFFYFLPQYAWIVALVLLVVTLPRRPHMRRYLELKRDLEEAIAYYGDVAD